MKNAVLSGISWLAYAIAFLLCLWALSDTNGVYPRELFMGVPVLVALYLLHLALRYYRATTNGTPRKPWGPVGWAYWAAALFLLPWTALNLVFGNVTVPMVLFHVDEGVEVGMQTYYTMAVVSTMILAAIFAHLIFIALRLFPFSKWLLTAALIAFIVINPLSTYIAGQQFLALASTRASNIHTEIVLPQITSVPEEKTNFVLVYLEGVEAAYAQTESFGDIFAPITALEPQGLKINSIAQLEMTAWTTAGIVASQCGLPLVPRGVFNRNKWGTTYTFLPGHTCLGDILREEGYHQELFKGAKTKFGSVGPFFMTHGADRTTGLEELRHLDPDDTHKWGMHDEVVFGQALETISGLEASDTPYFITIETVGPHGPMGSISRSCRTEGQSGETEDITLAVECTLELTAKFYNDLLDVVDLEDTLVVIMSDHLAHHFTSSMDELSKYERRNTFLALGAGTEPGSVISEPATMLDLYPTFLEMLGFEVEGRQAGMGVSLFSGAPTLVETHGLEVLDELIEGDLQLSKVIWVKPE